MSFLTRLSTAARTAVPLNAAATTPSLAVAGQRFVSSTAAKESGPVDATKSTLKKADRVVSHAAVKGIETGEAAASKIKQTVTGTSGKAKQKTGEMKGEAAEMASKGKGKAQEAAGEAKGKAKEFAR
ncbi:uncharacterized protein BJX67DRAFT_353981 [Aspergillus lucknowensis]|uniref:LEA domain protein n=1 Tax=Aspergillus lucknowensis TaxID=176173 RepID=A0ABR4LRD8_9EURO